MKSTLTAICLFGSILFGILVASPLVAQQDSAPCDNGYSFQCPEPCVEDLGHLFNCCSTFNGVCCERICRNVNCRYLAGENECEFVSGVNYAAGVTKPGSCSPSEGLCY